MHVFAQDQKSTILSPFFSSDRFESAHHRERNFSNYSNQAQGVNRDESTMILSREWCLWLISIQADPDKFVHGPPKPISSPREGHKRNRVYSPTEHEAHEGERPGPRNVQSPVELAARKALAVAKCRRQYSWKSFTSLLLTESGTRWRQLRLQPNSMARSLASPPLGIELRSKTARRVCRYMLSALATESHEDAGKAYVYIVLTYGKIAESRTKMGYRWLPFTFIGPFSIRCDIIDK